MLHITAKANKQQCFFLTPSPHLLVQTEEGTGHGDVSQRDALSNKEGLPEQGSVQCLQAWSYLLHGLLSVLGANKGTNPQTANYVDLQYPNRHVRSDNTWMPSVTSLFSIVLQAARQGMNTKKTSDGKQHINIHYTEAKDRRVTVCFGYTCLFVVLHNTKSGIDPCACSWQDLVVGKVDILLHQSLV